MAKSPLMPKATAVWLVENTSLTFEQVAEFCQLHELEVKGIADGDVAQGIRGMDPVASGQLSRDEIERGQSDSTHRLRLLASKVEIPEVKTKKGPKYTPLSRRQDRPAAIAWLVRNHPELRDSEIVKLVGTTKPTIQALRDRSHWNSANIQPQDPVTLGLSTQIELDNLVRKAARRVEKETGQVAVTLQPTEATIAQSTSRLEPKPEPSTAPPERRPDATSVFGPKSTEPAKPEPEEGADLDADSVFAKLAELQPKEPETASPDADAPPDAEAPDAPSPDTQADNDDQSGTGTV